MTVLTASNARDRLYRLIDEVGRSHQPVHIAGKRAGAVLLAEEDWRSIQETLHLVSIPGMRASIRRGLRTPIAKCRKEPGW